MCIGYKGISNYYRTDVSEVFNVFNDKGSDSEYIIIDVRKPNKYLNGVIPGALKISFDDFENKIQELDKSKNYILVCNYGGTSSLACEIMYKSGFKNVCNFQGGMLDWYDKNYPLEYNNI